MGSVVISNDIDIEMQSSYDQYENMNIKKLPEEIFIKRYKNILLTNKRIIIREDVSSIKHYFNKCCLACRYCMPIDTNRSEVFIEDISYISYSFDSFPFITFIFIILLNLFIATILGSNMYMIFSLFTFIYLYHFRYGHIVIGVSGKIYAFGEYDPLTAIVNTDDEEDIISRIQRMRYDLKRE